MACRAQPRATTTFLTIFSSLWVPDSAKRCQPQPPVQELNVLHQFHYQYFRLLITSLDMGYIQQVIEGRYIDKEKLLNLLNKEFGRGNFQVRVQPLPVKSWYECLSAYRYSLT